MFRQAAGADKLAMFDGIDPGKQTGFTQRSEALRDAVVGAEISGHLLQSMAESEEGEKNGAKTRREEERRSLGAYRDFPKSTAIIVTLTARLQASHVYLPWHTLSHTEQPHTYPSVCLTIGTDVFDSCLFIAIAAAARAAHACR